MLTHIVTYKKFLQKLTYSRATMFLYMLYDYKRTYIYNTHYVQGVKGCQARRHHTYVAVALAVCKCSVSKLATG